MKQNPSTRTPGEAAADGKALHGSPSEVSWDGGAGRQPYANQGAEEQGPAGAPETEAGNRGAASGRNRRPGAPRALILRSFYQDSVALMRISHEVLAREGVVRASLLMGTPANKDILGQAGLLASDLAGASPADLMILVEGDEAALAPALQAIDAALAGGDASAPTGRAEIAPRSIAMGVAQLGRATLAQIAVPGPYAAAEALKASGRRGSGSAGPPAAPPGGRPSGRRGGLDLDFCAELDDAVRRDAKELGRGARVPRPHGRQLRDPARGPRDRRRDVDHDEVHEPHRRREREPHAAASGKRCTSANPGAYIAWMNIVLLSVEISRVRVPGVSEIKYASAVISASVCASRGIPITRGFMW